MQTPTVDYNVVGSTIVFDEAPGNGVSVILREFTSPQVFLTGNVVLGTSSTDALTINSGINSNLLPYETETYNIGEDALRWKDLYLSGNTIVLGNIVIKDTGNSQIGFFQSNGTTPASIDPTNVDTSQIANGNSRLSVTGTNGNIVATINSGQVAVISAAGLNATNVTASGNVAATNITASGNASATNITASGNVSSLFNFSQRTITANATIGNVNASSVGPIIIAEGVTVTVGTGGEWSIV